MAATTSTRAAGLLLVLAPAAAGCAREPAEALCPEIAAGDLVITELRGDQMPKVDDAPWIEVYNASGRTLDLIGIRIALIEGTGVGTGSELVRRGLSVAPDGYVVFGLFGAEPLPPRIDYGFAAGAWTDHGAVLVSSCDEPIDLVQYTAPTMGTYSLGGAPDADRNDYTTSWCTDRTQAGTVFPGTPGLPNIPCP